MQNRNRDTHIASKHWTTRGKKCWGGKNWEIGIETYTLLIQWIYTMEYYSAVKKNSFESVLMRWVKLEPIIQSEVSLKEKHQYSILTHIYGI